MQDEEQIAEKEEKGVVSKAVMSNKYEEMTNRM